MNIFGYIDSPDYLNQLPGISRTIPPFLELLRYAFADREGVLDCDSGSLYRVYLVLTEVHGEEAIQELEFEEQLEIAGFKAIGEDRWYKEFNL